MNRIRSGKFLVLLLFWLAWFPLQLYAGTPALNSKPGDVLRVIILDQPGIDSVSAEFLGRRVSFFKTGEKWRGFCPSMPEQKPGLYPLVIETNGQTRAYQVRLLSKKFARVYFTLKPAQKRLMKPDLISQEWGEIERVLVVNRPEQLWDGKFARPVKGTVTMDFGTREFVNKKRRGSHRGVDFRAPLGTSAAAANRGIVVFAQTLQAFGGTMVIDHGQGVFSLYFHLSKFLVPVGQLVEKGESVAKTGNSGISSGPHLHWGLSVNNVRVNPIQWTKEEF